MDHEHNKQKKIDRAVRGLQRACKPVPPSHDFEVNNQGTIFLFTPLTQAAKDWIAEHIPDDATYFGKALVVVEHRYAADIAVGIIAAGLTSE